MEPKGPNGANLNIHEDTPYYNGDFLAFIYGEIYQDYLKKRQELDFADLISKSTEILTKTNFKTNFGSVIEEVSQTTPAYQD